MKEDRLDEMSEAELLQWAILGARCHSSRVAGFVSSKSETIAATASNTGASGKSALVTEKERIHID